MRRRSRCGSRNHPLTAGKRPLPNDRDCEFARIAVELKLLTQEQAEALLADLSTAESLGSGESIAKLAVSRGLLFQADCDALDERVERSMGRREEVGGFELIERIGRGGMGTVYRARQLSMDRIIALKILAKRLARSETYVRRFIREAQAAAKLNHPNIVQGINVGESNGYYYFAMEYINGETAAQKVKRAGPLSEKEAVAICRQMAQALDHAHTRANIIHRDVKPQNILLDTNGVAKLADLGLAREAVQGDATVTMTGVTLGTPDYISPEQIRGEADLDGRCDIYSLGATLYQLVTGKPPYRGETANVTMARHLTEPVPDPIAEGVKISPTTAGIIRKAMQKDKAARFQNATELAAALEAIERRLAAHDAVPPTVTASPRRPRAARAARRVPPVAIFSAIGIVLLALILIAVLANRDKKPAPPEPDASQSQGVVQQPQPEPEPQPEPQPKPEPPPPPGATEHELAKQAADNLRDDPARLIPTLEDILSRAAGTEYASAISVLLDNAKEELRTKAAGTLAELEDQADRLTADKSFGKALAALDSFPDSLRISEWPGKIESAKARVLAAADTSFQACRRRAEAAAGEQDFDRAIAAIEEVKSWGVPRLAVAAQGLADLWAEQKARAKTERFGVLVAHMEEVLVALKGRDYATAGTAAARAAADKRLGEEADAFRTLGGDVGALASLWDTAEGRLQAMNPGEGVRIGGILRKFVKFEKGVVTAQVSGLTESVRLKAMSDVDLFELLKPYVTAGAKDPAVHLKLGLFYTFDKSRDIEKARKAFDRVEKLGDKAGAERGRSYLDRLARLEPEQAALRCLAEARAAAAGKNWNELGRKLKEFETFRKTETYRRNETEVTRLVLLAAGRGRGLEHLFSGKTELKGADRVAISYDLAKAAQQRDWTGATRLTDGLRCETELRWGAGVRIHSIKLLVRMRKQMDRTELRVMCSAQGDRPLVMAGFGILRGLRSYVVGREFKHGGGRLIAGVPSPVELHIDDPQARLGIDKPSAKLLIGKEALQVPIKETGGGSSVFLVAGRTPVDVLGATVTGRLDLGWARRRVADLADIAESSPIKTVEVPADKEWVETGVVLKPGEYYYLRAVGWWQHGRLRIQGSGPAGKGRTYRGLPIFSLVGQVGGVIHYIGEEAIIGPYESGRLELGMNELPRSQQDNSGTLSVEIRQLPRRPDTGPGVARGLLARYYSGMNFERFKGARIDPAVDLQDDALFQAAKQRDNFSIRWDGYIRIEKSDEYEFGLSSDDGFRLWLDGKVVLDHWRASPRNKGRTRPLALDKGMHQIRVEYFQARGGAHIRLWWRPRNGKGSPVPREILFHSVSQAAKLRLAR